jgi:acyl carrier protein
MRAMSVHDRIREFILENFLFTSDESALSDDVSLTQGGVITSTGILELLVFLEETWRVDLRDDELTLENLDSVNRIAAFVERKLAGVM